MAAFLRNGAFCLNINFQIKLLTRSDQTFSKDHVLLKHKDHKKRT